MVESLPKRENAFSSDRELSAIDISAPQYLLADPVSANAIHDVIDLLRRGFPLTEITLNGPAVPVQFVLPSIGSSPFQQSISSTREPSRHLLPYPEHWYRWTSSRDPEGIVLKLEATSTQGVSCGLYGLLQEKLGYLFCHPRVTVVPQHFSWPLSDLFVLEGLPRFEKKGFHLHTLHPTELAERFLDPCQPGALDDIREYLDWLARNRQNVLQFYLVRTIDRARWTDHAERIVRYARERGILVGVHISLSMLQQQAFQVIRLLCPFASYRKQIDRTLDWLFHVQWDFVTIEPLLAEHLPDLSKYLPSTMAYLADRISKKHNARAFLSTHVIRSRKKRRREASPVEECDTGIPAGKENHGTGVMIHSVMCYSVTEREAPVYGNRDQLFILEQARAENSRRETWYWPESSYWITFDNSVPLFLLPYLEVRRDDMVTMESIGLPGHLTFSSGWEWGYWLIDWSVARWSWRRVENGETVEREPICFLNDLFPDTRMDGLWKNALELQNLYLKDRGLLRYMSALPPFAEMFRPFNRPFQPVPERPLHELLKRGGVEGAERVESICRELTEYAKRMESILSGFDGEVGSRGQNSQMSEQLLLFEELKRALLVTVHRARHRALVIRALAVRMGSRVPGNGTWRELLMQAADVRTEALELVRLQEMRYRYPVEQIARRRKSLTAYDFGYLYPVSSLHFWEREEEQVRNLRFDAFFMNIWDFRKILGVGGLFR